MAKKSDPKIFYDKGYYSVTLTAHDKYQFEDKPDRMIRFINHVTDLLLAWPQYGIQYQLYLELTEPKEVKHHSVGSRLHLHGIIKLCSKNAVRHFLLHEMTKLSNNLGQFEMDTIDGTDYWYKYCTKQQHIIQTPPLASNDNLFDEYMLQSHRKEVCNTSVGK